MSIFGSEEKFLEEVEKHKIYLKRDEDVHRYIRFRNPKDSCYWFEIITWPGCLCINGDCGTYVFQRVHDMFRFFRPGKWHKKGAKIPINTGYWHEKCLAYDRQGKVEEFNVEAFNEAVKYEFRSACKNSEIPVEKRRECWEEMKVSLLDPENEWDGFERVNSFCFGDFYIQDFWEHSIREYTPHYVWNLFAIVWGIQQYDNFHMMNDLKEMNCC